MRARVLVQATRSSCVQIARRTSRSTSSCMMDACLLDTNGKSRYGYSRSFISGTFNSITDDNVRDWLFWKRGTRRCSSSPLPPEENDNLRESTGPAPGPEESANWSEKTSSPTTEQRWKRPHVDERLDPYVYVPGDELMELRDFTIGFLGTSAGKGTIHRSNSATALRTDGATYLFDAGEGVQRQLMLSRVSAGRIHKIFSKCRPSTSRERPCVWPATTTFVLTF